MRLQNYTFLFNKCVVLDKKHTFLSNTTSKMDKKQHFSMKSVRYTNVLKKDFDREVFLILPIACRNNHLRHIEEYSPSILGFGRAASSSVVLAFHCRQSPR